MSRYGDPLVGYSMLYVVHEYCLETKYNGGYSNVNNQPSVPVPPSTYLYLSPKSKDWLFI